MSGTYLGVDLGGTNVRFGLVTSTGQVLKNGRFPVRSAERGPDGILDELTGRLRNLMADLPEAAQPRGLGIGAPGRILPERGVMVSAPNLPGWKNIHLAERFRKDLKLETRIDNDANLHALGEWLAGAGQGMNHMIMLTLGTGVGGGLVLDGRIWNGPFGSAGEVGHIVVEPEGHPCGCGGRGCLETIASANHMARTAREWIAEGRPTAYQGDPARLTAQDLHRLAQTGDELALAVFERAGWALGIALTGIFNLLGLEGAVMGGGGAGAFEFIYPRMFREFSERVFAVDPEEIKFATAALGDDAGLVGAAALFRDCSRA